jgi:hypothetical protein
MARALIQTSAKGLRLQDPAHAGRCTAQTGGKVRKCCGYTGADPRISADTFAPVAPDLCRCGEHPRIPAECRVALVSERSSVQS